MSAISTDIRNESLPARIYLLMLCTTSASSKYLLYDHISCFGRFDQAFSYVNTSEKRAGRAKGFLLLFMVVKEALGFLCLPATVTTDMMD